MGRQEAIEVTPEPRRITDPHAVLPGRITRDVLAHRITHEPVSLNHQQLDGSVREVNPMLGRALRMGVGLKDGGL